MNGDRVPSRSGKTIQWRVDTVALPLRLVKAGVQSQNSGFRCVVAIHIVVHPEHGKNPVIHWHIVALPFIDL